MRECINVDGQLSIVCGVRVPMVDHCQTFGHRRFEMCVFLVVFMFCAFVDNFARKQVEY
jgi:hypothetical protein